MNKEIMIYYERRKSATEQLMKKRTIKNKNVKQKEENAFKQQLK